MLLLPVATALLTVSSASFAWGQRGHGIVTRVAVHLVGTEPKHRELFNWLLSKEDYLAYLANTPDTVWKSTSVSEATREVNRPTHHYHADHSEKNVFTSSVLKSIDLPEPSLGTAPNRIHQFFLLLTKQFSELPKAKNKNTVMDQIILLSGLSSHFIGDLANPMHLTADFDGWGTNQGGLHSYFESDVISSYGLEFEQEVFLRAKDHFDEYIFDHKQFPGILAKFMWKSRQDLTELTGLDQKNAVMTGSSDYKGLRLPAKRRPAGVTSHKFRNLAVKRLADGGAMLAQFWLAAWQAGGSPKYQDYQSYHYDHTPEFILPDYVTGK